MGEMHGWRDCNPNMIQKENKKFLLFHLVKLSFVREEGRQLGEPAVGNIALSLMDFCRAGLCDKYIPEH